MAGYRNTRFAVGPALILLAGCGLLQKPPVPIPEIVEVVEECPDRHIPDQWFEPYPVLSLSEVRERGGLNAHMRQVVVEQAAIVRQCNLRLNQIEQAMGEIE